MIGNKKYGRSIEEAIAAAERADVMTFEEREFLSRYQGLWRSSSGKDNPIVTGA